MIPASALGATRTLTVTKEGFQKGTVTSSPAGIVCGSTCTADPGWAETCDMNGCTPTMVTLNTTLPSGFSVSWQGKTCEGPGETQTGTACTVPADDGTITARYIDATAPTISLTSPSSSGPFGGPMKLAASAFDSQSSVSRVDFTIGSTVVGTDTTSPYEFNFDSTGLPDGQVSVGAVAFNGDGQAKTANPRAVTIDNTAPQIDITSGPNTGDTFGAGTTQVLTFKATDASTTTTVCSLDSEDTFNQCTDTAAYSDLSEAPHVFRVQAIDAAGNKTTAIRVWNIDRTGPTATITSGPGEFSSDAGSTVTFGFATSEPPATVSCRLYAGGSKAPDFAPCTGSDSHTAGGLTPGDWVFEVQATDAYGNAGATTARHFSVVFTGGLDRISAKISSAFTVRGRSTRVRKLRLSKLPTGTRVTLTCRGRGCLFKTRSLSSRGGHATLEQLFKQRALRSGTLVTIRLTGAGLEGQQITYKIRSKRSPLRRVSRLA